MDNIGEGKIYQIYFDGWRKAIRNPSLSFGAKAILSDLLLYAGTNGKCFPSQEVLAKNSGKSSRQIRNILNELKNTKYILWERGHKGKSNQYSLNEEIYCQFDQKGRKQTSTRSGNTLPSTIGNTVPPNVINESTQKSSQSPLQITFKKECKRELTSVEEKQLTDMSNEYPGWVEDAIKEAGKRNYPIVKVGLVRDILSDWKASGKPQPKPKFQACGLNGCDEGFIQSSTGSYSECICQRKFRDCKQVWEKDWGHTLYNSR